MTEDDIIRIYAARQKTLADFGDFAGRNDDLDAVLHEACRLVAQALGTRRAKVLELQEDGGQMFLRAGIGWNLGVVGQVRIPMTEHSSESYSIKCGHPVTSSDIAQETRFEVPRFMRDEGVVALANVPILLPGGVVYGLLQVDDTRPHCFADHDIQFLRTYSAVLGPLIDRLLKVNALRESEERFRLTVESITDHAIFVTDPDDIITDWLPGAQAVFGWTAAEAVGQPGALVATPEDRETGQPRSQTEAAARDGSAPITRPHRRKDGAQVFIEGAVRALRDRRGVPTGFVRIGRDVTERHKADASLRTLMEGIPQLVWRSLDRGNWIWTSPQWLSFTGQSPDQARGWGWLEAVHPEDRDRTLQAWDQAQARGGLDIEFRIRRAADGAHLWHRTRSAPVHDAAGRITEWLGTSTDVQTQREAHDRQSVLVAELQHRTRNLISVVRSIATQTMAGTGPTPAFLDRFNDRLSALSRVQGLLSRSDHEPITLPALLRLELDALGTREGSTVRLDGAPVRIRPSLVQTLALGLHELTTNARKYGALSDSGGLLTVRWKVEEAVTGRRLVIDWQEEGILHGPAEGEAQDCGYGRRLIEKALPYSLGALTRYHLGADRLDCRIDLPLDRPTAAPAMAS